MLLDVGYIRGRWGFVLDAPWAYLVLGLAAAAALAFRIWELWSLGYLPLAAALAGDRGGGGRGGAGPVWRRDRLWAAAECSA